MTAALMGHFLLKGVQLQNDHTVRNVNFTWLQLR